MDRPKAIAKRFLINRGDNLRFKELSYKILTGYSCFQVETRRKTPHYDVTAGIIWRNGRVLITRRPKGTHLAGLWEFPGGKQEEGETLSACLEREIKEELGMRVKAGRLLFSVGHEYDTKAITLHVFQCTELEGEPKAMEGQEARWVHPRELPNLGFPPPDKTIIEFLLLSST
ncbi:MAG: 8-oxo-dGTP diphosphatase MutT [Deltaproteobacteria bacterium]|nr:8-oxo-dGTP diphosphatase MutT [Deltaproteobacteria bacterium]